MLQCSNSCSHAVMAYTQSEFTTLSKQLALSIAFSVLTMSAFALSMSPPNAVQNASPEYENGAVAEASAPPVFRILAD